MQNFTFHIPTQIVFGNGRVKELAERLDPSTERIMVVTDKIAGKESGALDAILPQLEGKQIILFNNVEENPSLETIEEGARQSRKNHNQCIIGIGGGSPMDAAKGIAVLTTNSGSMRDYMKGKKLQNAPLPIVCVPTTSGTGSEVTPFAVFTDRETESKGGYAHPAIFPRFSIIDPELTYSMPDPVIVNTGMDVLTHAIEAYLSTETFPMNDVLALEAIRMVIDHLNQAVKKEKEAMGALSYASMLAGIAIAHSSTILLHIMAYPLTVFHSIAHGRANAILLPHFMDFMRKKSTVQAKVKIVDGLFQSVGGINRFVTDLGISTRLSDYGITEKDLSRFTPKVIIKGDVAITPAHVTEKIIKNIYCKGLIVSSTH